MKILSIESSCDETSAAVTCGREVLSNIISTQIDEHRIYGGVVPEIASRRHCENIAAVVNEAISTAGVTYDDIDAVAVTAYPGLIGALLTGVNFAKGLSLSLSKPLIAVHHLRGHIAANYLTHKELKPPFLCLVVSGGNTVICSVKDYTDFSVIGQTLDDAAGECFDKCARAMGLPYPGGVNLDKVAAGSDESLFPLPTPKSGGGEYDFSFSGLKTAVLNLIHNKKQKGEDIDIPALCGTLRKKVCDILISKTISAAKENGFKKIVLAGGVSANSELRERMKNECEKQGFSFFTPELKYCGDNAAMIGAQAYYEFMAGNIADLSLNASATKDITNTD
ncbi:MAG: tRNA (adenosine(37)-N6)-threonylcarbamoyltransferase complex transferase subunit TsaD [Ruminococcaceae bacterium]|nr:tRNA (adenosine(37)-N6)-threonylcarbamoyltransferase complex transferase subunit TsaD [Oscillospiraceae bacterium]